MGLYVWKICFVILWALSFFFKQWNRSFFKSVLSVAGLGYLVLSSMDTRGWEKTLRLILALVLIALLTAAFLYQITLPSGGELPLPYLIGVVVIDALIYLKLVHILDREQEE